VPLSAEQIRLLNNTIRTNAPHLLSTVDRLRKGELISDGEADALEDVLANEMTRELTADGGLTALGIQVDNLIGVCRQHAESFFRDD
jgi:hypothetical protein